MDYNQKLHLIGRIWMSGAILLFIAIPLSMGIYYGETPNWKVFGSAAVIIPLIINALSGIVEPIIYAPMLGTNSEYLAFMTGNLSNLKIPCVVKAQEIMGTKVGTEENELVSTIAVATSTLVTVLAIAILVLCLGVSNLQGIIQKNAWIYPAFSCVVYALFGSLGGKYVAKNPKLAIIPAIFIVALSAGLGAAKLNVGSAYLMVGIAVCAIFAIFQFVREKKKIAAKKEQERLEQIAAGNPEIDELRSDEEKNEAVLNEMTQGEPETTDDTQTTDKTETADDVKMADDTQTANDVNTTENTDTANDTEADQEISVKDYVSELPDDSVCADKDRL